MPDWLKRRIQSWRQRIDYPGMSEGEFDTSATKHQEYGVETLGSLLVGTTANSQPQLWDGAVFRIWMMTLATDAYQKRRSKKYKLKIQFFTNGFLANGLKSSVAACAGACLIIHGVGWVAFISKQAMSEHRPINQRQFILTF